MRGRLRWGLVIAVTVLVIGYLMSSAFGAGAMYYVTVEEYLAQADDLEGRFVRVNGFVAPGSVDWRPTQVLLRFNLQASEGGGPVLPVVYRGVRPDLLADGVEVIVEGRPDASGQLVASQVLVKCPSKYEPATPER